MIVQISVSKNIIHLFKTLFFILELLESVFINDLSLILSDVNFCDIDHIVFCSHFKRLLHWY